MTEQNRSVSITTSHLGTPDITLSGFAVKRDDMERLIGAIITTHCKNHDVSYDAILNNHLAKYENTVPAEDGRVTLRTYGIDHIRVLWRGDWEA